MSVTARAIILGSTLALFIAWIAVGIGISVYLWFSPVPPGAFKLDAYDELRLSASVLNFAAPLGLLISVATLTFRKILRMPVAVVASLVSLYVASTAAAVVWWHYMEAAHSPLSLANHLWWTP